MSHSQQLIWIVSTGRGPPADSAMVSLHQILLPQPGRLEKTEERAGKHHDQRHGQERGDWQGVQPAELINSPTRRGEENPPDLKTNSRLALNMEEQEVSPDA